MPKTRKLAEHTKQAIHQSITGVWAGPLREGVDPAPILDMIERYVVGLLENVSPELLYETTSDKKNVRRHVRKKKAS